MRRLDSVQPIFGAVRQCGSEADPLLDLGTGWKHQGSRRRVTPKPLSP